MTSFAFAKLLASAKLLAQFLSAPLVCYEQEGGMIVCAESSYMLAQPPEFRVDCSRSPNFCRHLWCCPDEPSGGEVEGCFAAAECDDWWVRCPDVWSNAGTCG